MVYCRCRTRSVPPEGSYTPRSGVDLYIGHDRSSQGRHVDPPESPLRRSSVRQNSVLKSGGPSLWCTADVARGRSLRGASGCVAQRRHVVFGFTLRPHSSTRDAGESTVDGSIGRSWNVLPAGGLCEIEGLEVTEISRAADHFLVRRAASACREIAGGEPFRNGAPQWLWSHGMFSEHCSGCRRRTSN